MGVETTITELILDVDNRVLELNARLANHKRLCTLQEKVEIENIIQGYTKLRNEYMRIMQILIDVK